MREKLLAPQDLGQRAQRVQELLGQDNNGEHWIIFLKIDWLHSKE